MKKILAVILAISGTFANAGEVSQRFLSNWTVEPWNYYGDIAAMQWHYLEYEPWDSKLGKLTSVSVTTTISGTRQEAEELKYRYSFFTGWNPADYQFYRQAILPASSLNFSIKESYTFSSAPELKKWENNLYFPPANYYFESRTLANGHSIVASTELQFSYVSAIPEMPTAILLGLGLLSFAFKRQSGVA